jgi:hypothetical protein
MAQANDSIDVTPGTGATVATHLVAGKEYQVVMVASSTGQIEGSNPTYSAWSTAVAASANMVYMHIFNATGSGKIVKLRKLFVQPSQAVNALAAQNWRVAKTSAVGTTGNTAITIQKHDSADANPPAQITAARGYTAGGTQTFTFFEIPLSVEETLPAVGQTPFWNLLPVDGERVADYTIREGEGVAVQNLTGGAYTWSVLAVFTIE